ncbi:ATP-binding protein [Streptomyces acidicola]|uniref:ATP-binding protein n=1 Tax=Streptomyces acidicola TaxID=2596892 RepID=UPI003799CD49
MSQLRAPTARSDRREGGRHGRPVARTAPSLPETPIRSQLLRLAVLPPIAVALSAGAAVLFTVRSTGARPSPVLWAVLAGAVGVTLAGIVIAAVAAGRAAKSVSERLGALRRTSARGEADLRTLVEALRRGEGPPERAASSEPAADADEFELLAADLAHAHDAAVTAVVQASRLSSQAGSEQKVEVFVNLARRLQSLVHREISILDELENEIEDPDLLKGLFHVDHLATRTRRHAENLAVLGGAVSRRQWSNPVPMTEVLRSAIAEVEQYSRVKLVPPIEGTLRGHAVADVIHLLAELVENATVFSAPHTQVLLRANIVTSGLAVEVEDRGLGMPVSEQNKMNTLLADPDHVNVASLLQDGRIGLFVVSQLARRHGIHVRLQTNIYGGVQAVLIVPQGLLGTEPGTSGDVPQPQPQLAATQPQPQLAATQPQPTATQPQPNRSAPGPGPGLTGQGAAHAVPRQQTPHVPGGGPSRLPVRDTRQERPNPADALPGIRPDDRRALLENATTPPVPRTGAVPGATGKPQLPRRRAQEHMAPQLRGGPAPTPRQDPDHYVGHDPGLMAAFQRGIGLAEAHHMEQGHMEQGHMDTTAMEPGHTDTVSHADASHMDALHTDTASTLGVLRLDSTPIAVPSALDAAHLSDAPTAHLPHEGHGSRESAPGPDLTARHDGSTPTG